MFGLIPSPATRRGAARRAMSLMSLVLFVVASTAAPARTGAAAPLFAAPFLAFDTGVGPITVAIGDLNGDGIPDLATANYGSYPDRSGTVSVLLGNGDGSFRAKVDYATGSGAWSVAIDDLNGDGNLDLVVTNIGPQPPYGNTLSVLLGNGDGTFRARRDYETGLNPYAVAIRDLNADGKPDLVVSNAGVYASFGSTVSVLIGNGDGSFGAKRDYEVGPNPSSVAIGDLDGDGKPDLAVANSGSNTVSVLSGNGDGTFRARTDYVAGSGAHGVAIGDLNGDGIADLAVANTAPYTVSVLLGNGGGSFGAKTDFATGWGPYAVAIWDLNGDGKADLAVRTGGSVAVLLGDGSGNFGAHTDFETAGGAPSNVIVGDLNGDGKPDLATANGSANSVSILLGNGNGTFGAETDVVTGSGPCSAAIGDFDGDGVPDLATGNIGWSPAYRGTVSVLLGRGNGSFGTKTDYGTGSSEFAMGSVAVGELNGDGRLDLVAADDGVWVLLGHGDGTFATRVIPGTTGSNGVVAIGDLNGDGRADLVMTDGSNLSVRLGDGAGGFGAKTSFATGSGAISLAIGDLNGDGRPDLVSANIGSNTVSVLLGMGDGTFGAKTDFATDTQPRSVAIGDMNQDGIPDLVTASSNAHTVSVLMGRGDGAFRARRDFETGNIFFTSCVALGDLNGDGLPDIAAPNAGGSTVSILPGNGLGLFGAKTSFGTGALPVYAAIGDMDRNGTPDLVVVNNGSSSVSVLLNLAPALPTPTLVELFRALPGPDGIRVEWELSSPGSFQSIELQRSAFQTGAWSRVQQAPRVQGRITSVLDTDAVVGQEQWYQLSCVQPNGPPITFGPISATAQGAITMFALSPISPNPTTGQALLSLAIPTSTRVRLTLCDVQGRELVVLADGMRAAGRYAAALESGDLRAGIYFVRMHANGVTHTRRLVVVR